METNNSSNSTLSLAYTYVENLVKSNEALIDTIDNDPELKSQYEKDIKNFETSKAFQDELTAVLFDNLHLSVREEGEISYLDIAKSRSIPYRYLRRAGETEGPQIIKSLRRLQLTEYAMPAFRKRFGNEKGFSLAWKNPNYEPTEAQKKEVDGWTQRIQEKFFFPAGETTPSLVKWIGEAYDNFFDLDDITYRIMRDKTFFPVGIRMEDPVLWKPTIPKIKEYPRFDLDLLQPLTDQDWQIDVPIYDYLMMKDEKRVEAVSNDIVRKSHFFTRSDFQLQKRGYSIMEKAVNITSIIINAVAYNASTFTTDRAPMGVLALTGGFTNQLIIEKLKKVLWAHMSNASNKKRLPIVGLPEGGDAKWISMHGNNKEMEFYTGMSFFLSILFALSGTNPNEAGLASFQDVMKGSHLNEADPSGVYKQSQDNGMKMFINHIENTLNTPGRDGQNVIEEATRLPLIVEFKGLAAEDLKEKYNLNKSRLESTASINDLLREEKKRPVKSGIEIAGNDIFDIPAFGNSAFNQIFRTKMNTDTQKEQAAEQAALAGGQQAGPGMPGQQPGQGEEMTDADKKLIEMYGEPEEQQGE